MWTLSCTPIQDPMNSNTADKLVLIWAACLIVAHVFHMVTLAMACICHLVP